MSGEADAAPIGPDALRLRGDPPRVMRLSRKTLAAGGLVVSVGISGALLYALQPSVPKAPAELYEAGNGAAAGGLADGPKDYAQVPRLGPPLPGDLGRPILSAQQRGIDAAPPPIGRETPSNTAARNRADMVREHLAQERDAARTSKVFLAGDASAQAASSLAATSMPPAGTAVASVPPPGAGENAARAEQDTRRSFLQGTTKPIESAYRLQVPGSAFVVQAGSVIPAALITGIRSDLPGTITAQVTQNVYDSVTGRHLLVPQGSRLIGEYDSQVLFGQNRVLLAWDRLILPDGRSIQLDRLPGTDTAGYAGLQDRVNQHWGGMLRAALISTLLSIGTEVGQDDDDAMVRALRAGGADSIARTGQDLVRRQMNVQPTLTIRPGFPLRVLVTRDMVFDPAGGPR